MKITRRTFLFAAGAFAASPLLAGFLPSARGIAPELPLPAASANQTDLVFKIDGWSARGEAASATCGEVWLTVNRSWRTAWR